MGVSIDFTEEVNGLEGGTIGEVELGERGLGESEVDGGGLGHE